MFPFRSSDGVFCSVSRTTESQTALLGDWLQQNPCSQRAYVQLHISNREGASLQAYTVQPLFRHLCMVAPFPLVQREPLTLLGEKSLFPTEMTQIKGLFSPCSWVCRYTHLLYICATRFTLHLQTHRLLLAELFIEDASRCLLKASPRAASDLDSSLLNNLRCT